jgi:hypothetical protein
MRAQEITTASGQDILDYVKSIHHDFRLDSEILDHAQWRLSHVPLGQLHIPDPESGEDESDPYDRVQWMDMAHVDDIKQRDIDNKPIVIDTNGYILDGNHRALAARLSGRQTIPAWVPVPDLDESVLRLKQDQQAREFIDQVYALYPQTWQNNHVMTWGEGDEQELAMFELVPNPARPGTVEVKWFQAYPLRRGIGSRAMRELQRLAQAAGVDLSLYVWDKGQVSAAKLARFYRAQGFRPTAKGSRSMTWSPVNETVPGLKFLRPGELRGSYTNAQLQALGFRQARNGAWFIPQRRWQELTQSGQLREQQLQERVSSTIYHYTNILAGLQAVKSGQFELSSVLGSEWEQQFAPRGYPYFFSATRTRTGGYHDYVGDTAVMFVLDGDWFNSRYPGGSVDYWGNRDPKQSSHRAHEAEDRIFSRERSIPTGGVRAVHVLAKPDADPQHRAWARQLIIAAKQQNLPVYLYNDAGAWRALDTRKTVKPNYLTGQDAARGRGTRGHRGYLMPWMELIWGRDRSSLSKRAQSVLYNLNYHYDRSESVKILGVDLSNARKPSSGPDRENAVKIISYMRKNRLADLAALADHVRDRWKSLEPVREELIRTGRLQENTVTADKHQDDESKKVTVRPSPGKGNGLFAKRHIKQGEVITRSKFVPINDHDWQLIKDTTPVKLYGFILGNSHALQPGPFPFQFKDPREKELWSRTKFPNLRLSGFMFINGADQPSEVNSREKFHGNTAEMIATRDIEPGEEIIKQYNVPVKENFAAEGTEQNSDKIRNQLNSLMDQDQQYTDPTQRISFQNKVWPYIQKNIKAILADKGEKGNGDYPAAPYAAWLLVQHMDANPQHQIEFYNQLKKAIPNHPKIQFLRDRAAVNQWILKNADDPRYFHNGRVLPNPTVNVRNPAIFSDAGIVAASRQEALQNARDAGNKLLVAAVRATRAQTQPSYRQDVAESVPQPGKSSGKPISWVDLKKVETKYLTLDEILKTVTGIPYYTDVVKDRDAKDFTWGVTKKVLEYARALLIRPDSYKNWPPVIVVDGKLQDGAHRISTLNLMQQRIQPNNPIWKTAKLKVEFGSANNIKQGVAEGSENNNVTAQKIFFARSNKAPKGWSYDHIGFITQDGKQIQMSGHKGNDVYVTNAVTDDPEFPKQNIKVVSLPKPVVVPTSNTVGAENCGTFVANVLQANNVKGFDIQKIYSIFKKQQEQGVAENFADGRKPGRRGLAKRSGVDCKQSVSKLRSIAKHSSGERQRMAHWCANMKSGRKKSRR